MSYDDVDRTASTEKFQAFVDDDAPQQPPARQSGPPVGVIAGVIGVVVVLAVLAWLLLAG